MVDSDDDSMPCPACGRTLEESLDEGVLSVSCACGWQANYSVAHPRKPDQRSYPGDRFRATRNRLARYFGGYTGPTEKPLPAVHVAHSECREYWEGALSYGCNDSETECPYEIGDGRRVAWFVGFLDVQTFRRTGHNVCESAEPDSEQSQG